MLSHLASAVLGAVVGILLTELWGYFRKPKIERDTEDLLSARKREGYIVGNPDDERLNRMIWLGGKVETYTQNRDVFAILFAFSVLLFWLQPLFALATGDIDHYSNSTISTAIFLCLPAIPLGLSLLFRSVGTVGA